MRTLKNRKVIARWQTTNRTMIVLSMIFTPMIAEERFVFSRLPRLKDHLSTSWGEENFTPSKIQSLEFGRADRQL